MNSRQVPRNPEGAPAPTYCLLGAGRLARHLGHYLTTLGQSFTPWSRRSDLSLGQAAEHARVILLLVSDDAIESLARELSPGLRPGQRLVHCSGALHTPLALGAHPLMTFGPELYDRATYEGIPWMVEYTGDEAEATEARQEFHQLFPALPNPVFALRAEQKGLYHALCVLSGNFTTLLWSKLFRDFEDRLRLPPEAALPYLRQTARNLESHSGSAWPPSEALPPALTGPLARRDLATIEKNLAALGGDPFQGIYRAFVEALLVHRDRALPGNAP